MATVSKLTDLAGVQKSQGKLSSSSAGIGPFRDGLPEDRLDRRNSYNQSFYLYLFFNDVSNLKFHELL